VILTTRLMCGKSAVTDLWQEPVEDDCGGGVPAPDDRHERRLRLLVFDRERHRRGSLRRTIANADETRRESASRSHSSCSAKRSVAPADTAPFTPVGWTEPHRIWVLEPFKPRCDIGTLPRFRRGSHPVSPCLWAFRGQPIDSGPWGV
jgi:hypothetical protein